MKNFYKIRYGRILWHVSQKYAYGRIYGWASLRGFPVCLHNMWTAFILGRYPADERKCRFDNFSLSWRLYRPRFMELDSLVSTWSNHNLMYVVGVGVYRYWTPLGLDRPGGQSSECHLIGTSRHWLVTIPQPRPLSWLRAGQSVSTFSYVLKPKQGSRTSHFKNLLFDATGNRTTNPSHAR